MSHIVYRVSLIAYRLLRTKRLLRLTFDASRITFYALLILSLWLPQVAVQAQGITVTSVSMDYTFAQRMTLRIAARSDADIRSAKVYVRARNAPPIEVTGV